jgi:type I restriction enzyme S subunit
MRYRLAEVIDFNPTERLPKGTVAKKVAMEKVLTFSRDISGYEVEPYNGGTKFRNGDTIMARITPCLENGKSAYISFLDDGEIGYGSTEFIVWRAKAVITDSEYVYYLSQSPEIRDVAVKSMVGTSGRQRVQQSVLDNYVINLPPLHVQRDIAATLSALDAKIAANGKVNHNLEQTARAIFAELCSDGELGKLSDLVSVCYGKDHKRLANGQVPCYGSGGVMRHVDTALYNGESVLIPRKGTLNNVLYVNEPFWTVDTMFYTRMKCPNVAKFVYFTILGFDLAGMNVGSAVPSMTTAVLNELEILIPQEAVLSQFEQCVAPLFAQMFANEGDNRRLALIRDSLLPRLMNGEFAIH